MPTAPTVGYQVHLQAVGPYRPRVLVALRQSLGLGPADAQAYMASAPVLLAVGVPEEVAMRLRAALIGAGATVAVQAPPPPAPPPEKQRPPKPEVRRSMALAVQHVRDVAPRRGTRTVTGIAMGRTFSYVASARVEGARLVAPVDFVRFDARIFLPTAVRPAGRGSGEAFGLSALAQWPRYPDDVRIGFLTDVGKDAGESQGILRSFLKAIAIRITEVLGPDALDADSGSETVLNLDPDWSPDQVRLLTSVAADAGLPVVRLVPDPLAALSHHLQKGTLKGARGPEHVMVIDWGGQGLSTSFVERGIERMEPAVIDHADYPMGGLWIDMLLEEWLLQKLPEDLEDEDRRALSLFARDFKEEASRSFAEGRNEHVQYCVIPAGTPPTRISVSRTEMDALLKEPREQVQKAIAESVGRIGFKPEHLDHVLLVGGGARWYFAREAVRSALGIVPHIGPEPEEIIPRGLALSGLTLTRSQGQ